jgi:hypothetical protein
MRCFMIVQSFPSHDIKPSFTISSGSLLQPTVILFPPLHPPYGILTGAQCPKQYPNT